MVFAPRASADPLNLMGRRGDAALRDRGASVRGDAIGAGADLGVLLPIAIVLITSNGLSPTAVFLGAGLFYLLAALAYRAPVPVQPMKAFAAFGIAGSLSGDIIASGALLIGAILFSLSLTRLVDVLSRVVPLPVIRGVQLAVGLALLKVAWNLTVDPDQVWRAQPSSIVVAGLAAVVLCALLLRPKAGLLFALVTGVAVMVLNAGDVEGWGPAPVHLPEMSTATLWTALTVLVIPQLPLTLTSSCLATSDAMHHYHGTVARRVSPRRLARSIGTANLFVAATSGMAMCHGSGGVTAHYRFGARSALAPALIGTVLVTAALTLGTSITDLLSAFPLPVLVAMLTAAGLLHVQLVRGLPRRLDVLVALSVGVLSLWVGLAWLVVAATLLWWLVPGLRANSSPSRPASSQAG